MRVSWLGHPHYLKKKIPFLFVKYEDSRDSGMNVRSLVVRTREGEEEHGPSLNKKLMAWY